nr:reverse transcriptase domain-containing protein [Tanacetum cinerariifolium]
MTAHHNDWDTSAQRSESSSFITSSLDSEIVALKAQMEEINKNLMKVLQINQQFKAFTHSCKTCDGPYSYNDCPATIGQTQNVYAAGAYQGGEQLRKKLILPSSYSWSKTVFRLSSTSLSSPRIPSSGSSTPDSLTTNMTSLTNSNLELKNMFGQFIKMNTASSSGLGTLLSNTVTNLKEDLKVECETEVTKDIVPPTNNGSTKDVQPPGNDKLPVIIAKDLSVEEKGALIKVLKSHKLSSAWKLSDIKAIDSKFCTHEILMEGDFEPAVQHQRRVNLKIHEVIVTLSSLK